MREIRLSGSEGGGSDPKPGPPTPILVGRLSLSHCPHAFTHAT